MVPNTPPSGCLLAASLIRTLVSFTNGMVPLDSDTISSSQEVSKREVALIASLKAQHLPAPNMALLSSFGFSFLKEHRAATMSTTFTQIKSSLQELSPSAWVVFITGFCFLVLFKEFRSWSRLNHVPGPFSYSISKLPMARIAAGGRLSHHLQELGDRYGTE